MEVGECGDFLKFYKKVGIVQHLLFLNMNVQG